MSDNNECFNFLADTYKIEDILFCTKKERRHLWIKISKTLKFLENICRGRDRSHGYDHGLDVASLAVLMFISDLNSNIFVDIINNNDIWEILELIIVCGLLHDVDDSKYDFDGRLCQRLEEFLVETFHDQDSILKLNIIHNVSWSKEIKKREKLNVHEYWMRLVGIKGYIALLYVIDADRNESLWKKGHDRSIEYNTKTNLKSNICENNLGKELFRYVDKIVNDKLKILDQYCYTACGKRLAIRGRKELCKIHLEWKRQLDL